MPARSRSHLACCALLVLCAMALSGCRSQPMVRPSPLMSPLGERGNREAILRGMAAHRWALVDEELGRVTARFDKKNVGQHVATVDILYDADRIEIRYRDSHGLRCDQVDAPCESIHRAYNRWVVQLARDIEYGMQMVRVESLTDRPVGAGPRE